MYVHVCCRVCFFALGGFSTLSKIFHLLLDHKSSCPVPLRSVLTCCRTWTLACAGHAGNTVYVLKNNHLTALADILLDRLLVLVPPQQGGDETAPNGNASAIGEDYNCEPPQEEGPQTDPVAKAVLSLLAQALEDLSVVMREEARCRDRDGQHQHQSDSSDTSARAQDQISYVVALGIIDRLATYLQGVQDPIDGKPEVGEMLLACLNFMSALAGAAEQVLKVADINNGNNSALSSSSSAAADPTYMLQAYRVTELAGLVSMLYGLLLHQGAPARDGCNNESSPPTLPSYVVSVAVAASRLLLRLARQELLMVQGVLAQEGISLEFRHIASYLLWFCCQQERLNQRGSCYRDLLHLTITLVGYFSAKHEENQVSC